ncbi:hypothetical protein TRVL_09570 [Trypanosoma vivax]|nr:hypothetical protein TRVL_09570 [Trypanosoma vivax]
MPQYSLTADLHCSPLQLHQHEQLAPQLSAAVSTPFLLFLLDHSQSTSLFRYLLHRRLKTLMSLKMRSSCFAGSLCSSLLVMLSETLRCFQPKWSMLPIVSM